MAPVLGQLEDPGVDPLASLLRRWKTLGEELRGGDEAKDFRRASSDAYEQMKDSLSPEQDRAIRADGARVREWSVGPGYQAWSAVTDIAKKNPKMAELIEENRPALERYTRMMQSYHQSANDRAGLAKQLVEEGEFRDFGAAQKALQVVFDRAYEDVQAEKEKLPEIVTKRKSAISAERGSSMRPDALITTDLFPAPVKPGELPDGFFDKKAGATARGFFEALSFGSEEWKARIALTFPKPEEAKRALGFIPYNSQAAFEDLGLTLAWAPSAAVGGGAAAVTGKVVSKLGPALRGGLKAAAGGGATGLLNPTDDITDVKSRLLTGGILAGVGGGIGGAAASTRVRKAGSGLIDKFRKKGVEKAADDVVDAPRVEPEGAIETPLTEAQKAQIELQMAKDLRPANDQARVRELMRAIEAETDPTKKGVMLKTLRATQSRILPEGADVRPELTRGSSGSPLGGGGPQRVQRASSEQVVTGLQERMDALVPGATAATRETVEQTIETLVKQNKGGTEARVRGLRAKAKKLAREGKLEAAAAVREQADFLGRDITGEIARLRRLGEFMEKNKLSTASDVANFAGRRLRQGHSATDVFDEFDRAVLRQEFTKPGATLRGLDVPGTRSLDERVGRVLEDIRATEPVRKSIFARVDRLKAEGMTDTQAFDSIRSEIRGLGIPVEPPIQLPRDTQSAIRSQIRSEADQAKRLAIEDKYGLTADAPPPMHPPGPPQAPLPLVRPKGGATPSPLQAEGELLSVLSRMNDELRALKPINEAQRSLDAAETARKTARLGQIQQGAPASEARLIAERAARKGANPVAPYQPIGHKFSESERNLLLQWISDFPAFGPNERANAATALVDKVFGKDGVRVPAQFELKLLGQVFGEDFVEAIARETLPQTRLYNIMGGMRALMASDMGSALLNQGVVALYRHPKIWARSATKNFQFFFSDDAFQRHRQMMVSSDNFQRFRKAGLQYSSIVGHEEPFQMARAIESWAGVHRDRAISDRTLGVAQRGVGRWVRASDRAYSGFSTQLRHDVMDKLVLSREKGLGRVMDAEELRSLATMVNDFTGYGTLWKKTQNAAGQIEHVQVHMGNLSTLLFSPRYQVSGLKIMNPLTYVDVSNAPKGLRFAKSLSPQYDEFVRREALKTYMSLMGGTTAVLGLASLAPGVDVTWNPLSSDFMKIRMGKTRIDPLRGLGQFSRLPARFIAHANVLSTTGELRVFGEGRGFGDSTADQVFNMLENKMAPFVGAVFDQLGSRDNAGRPLRAPLDPLGVPRRAQMLVTRFVPMFTGDILDVWRTDRSLMPYALVFPQVGLNLQTYPLDTTLAMDDARRMAVSWAAQENRPTAELRQMERKYRKYKALAREEGDKDKIARSLEEADRSALRVVEWGRRIGL